MEDSELKINDFESENLLSQATYDNFLGKGANGIVYKVNYKNKLMALKIANPGKKGSLLKELEIYKYLCKTFNQCYCDMNIVQMLG